MSVKAVPYILSSSFNTAAWLEVGVTVSACFTPFCLWRNPRRSLAESHRRVGCVPPNRHSSTMLVVPGQTHVTYRHLNSAKFEVAYDVYLGAQHEFDLCCRKLAPRGKLYMQGCGRPGKGGERMRTRNTYRLTCLATPPNEFMMMYSHTPKRIKSGGVLQTQANLLPRPLPCRSPPRG